MRSKPFGIHDASVAVSSKFSMFLNSIFYERSPRRRETVFLGHDQFKCLDAGDDWQQPYEITDLDFSAI